MRERRAVQPNEPDRRLAAILVADVVGYSRMMGSNEAAALARLAAVRRAVVDPSITMCKGRIFKLTGDGLLAEFPSSVDALAAALRIQNGVGALNAQWPTEEHINFRIGVHQGEVLAQGGDLFGDGVIVAARLEPLAPAGGICVSHRVRQDAAGKLPNLRLEFEDLGERALKNIAEPVRVHHVHLPACFADAAAFAEALPAPASPIDLPAPPAEPARPRLWLGRPRAGLVRAVPIAVAIGAGLAWWDWNELAGMPLVAAFLDRIERRPIVAVKPGHLTIALAHLEDDKDQEHEKLLLDRLTNYFDGAQTKSIDRTIALPDADTEQDALTKAETQASELRAQAGVDVLLWGRVVSLGGKSEMRLYWTTGERVTGAKPTGLYEDQTDTIALPPIFWGDLKQVLGLLVRSRIVEIERQENGHYSADKLAPLIDQVRKLLQAQQGAWSTETDAKVRYAFAGALSDYGDQAGDNRALQESVDAYDKVLTVWTRDRMPYGWARVQDHLSFVLRRLGDSPGGQASLESAVAACRAALQVMTHERQPLHWARAQNCLGSALRALGERETRTEDLDEAVTAYRLALQQRTRDKVPLDWARTQNNLGIALRVLGTRKNDSQLLEEAVAAHRAALEEWRRDRVPFYWAQAQTDLGRALAALGERENGLGHLFEAAAAYRAALQEYNRDSVPLYWARAQFHLGDVLWMLGKRVNGNTSLLDSVSAYRAALKVWTRDAEPHDWAETQYHLGNVLWALGKREAGPTNLRASVSAYRAALGVWTPDRAPHDWAETQYELGDVLLMLSGRESGTTTLEAAAAAYRAVVQEWTRDRAPLNWAVTEYNLGNVLDTLAKRTGSLARLDEATIARLEAALTCDQNAANGFQQIGNLPLLRAAQKSVNAIEAELTALRQPSASVTSSRR